MHPLLLLPDFQNPPSGPVNAGGHHRTAFGPSRPQPGVEKSVAAGMAQAFNVCESCLQCSDQRCQGNSFPIEYHGAPWPTTYEREGCNPIGLGTVFLEMRL